MSRVVVNHPQPLDAFQQESLVAVQKNFGKRLRSLRHEKLMTIEQVAEGAGLHANYVGSVERGERNVSLFNIWRIAHSLGLKPEVLMTSLPEPQVPNHIKR
ncbi:helix-turn-helix transcriptional regulator [Lampropedia puyangensis]|uniref:Helix-turn-helix transcriptional regulator n=1 Tax=Lampropedia puyangensis TaxID=1330072 RepID=A0A4S8EUZ6_9BURK|nr:helix-turn-helix transcriptional regulator [Lampropedia puyangensis]THT98707.1 helix-turn-helix transcriptional regulator [Lampropedia puyangensis]